MSEQSTALTIAQQSTPNATSAHAASTLVSVKRGPLRPISTPKEVVEARNEVSDLIKEALVKGRDYGQVPGTSTKPVLLKAGAELILASFGCRVEYKIIAQEIDHDRINTFKSKYGKGESKGLYRYTLQALVYSNEGLEVGQGIGSCSSMEGKYISRPADSENTVLKMAKKRSLVDAVLSTFTLSDRFTQDIEEMSTERVSTAGSSGMDAEYEPIESEQKTTNGEAEKAKAAAMAELKAAFEELKIPKENRKGVAQRIMGETFRSDTATAEELNKLAGVLREGKE